MKNAIALFGGSFDPVTKAHESVISQISKIFYKVIVLPTYVSPFKLQATAQSGNDRVEMLKLATVNYDNVQVSTYELDKKGTSYTYETVKHFYNDTNKELYFIIGSDGLNRLTEWKNINELAQLVTFLVVPRPFCKVDKKLISKYDSAGIKIKIANFTGSEGSSTLARVAVAFNELNNYVSPLVAQYILENKLYDDYLKFTNEYSNFNLKPERVKHTFRAIQYASKLAKIHNCDEQKAVIALILHDVAKYLDDKTAKKLNINVSEELWNLPSAIRHAPISAEVAKQYFNVLDTDILDAICYHTTGRANMSKLEKIVYLADACEVGRNYDNVENLRKVADVNLDKAMLISLTDTVSRVKEDLYHLSVSALEYYKKIVKE